MTFLILSFRYHLYEQCMEGDIMNFHLDPWLFQPKGDDVSFNASISACEKSTQWNQVPRSEGEEGAK